MSLTIKNPARKVNLTDLSRAMRGSSDDVTGVSFLRGYVVLHFLDHAAARRSLLVIRRNCPALEVQQGGVRIAYKHVVELHSLPPGLDDAQIRTALAAAGADVQSSVYNVNVSFSALGGFGSASIDFNSQDAADSAMRHFKAHGIEYFDEQENRKRVYRPFQRRHRPQPPEELHEMSIRDQTTATQRIFTPKRQCTTENVMWRRSILQRRVKSGVFVSVAPEDARYPRASDGSQSARGLEIDYYETFRRNDAFYNAIGRRWRMQ